MFVLYWAMTLSTLYVAKTKELEGDVVFYVVMFVLFVLTMIFA